ncbi:MAG: DUF2461 domain-containing protein [Ignavibacteria bacterium]
MLNELIKQPFLGFPTDATKFLKSLANPKNNNKLWFDSHRDKYEMNLKSPMRELIDSLAIEINKIDTDIVVNYKSIFRINRDIRFSKDKTPYKSYYSAAFTFNRIKSAELPHFYFQFNSKEFLFAAGQYSMDINYLKRIRKAIYDNFKQYKSIITNKFFIKEFGEIKGESLTKLPKGFENIEQEKNDPLLVKNLKLKQFYVYKTYSPDVILSDEVIEIIKENIKLTHNFTKFIDNVIK